MGDPGHPGTSDVCACVCACVCVRACECVLLVDPHRTDLTDIRHLKTRLWTS